MWNAVSWITRSSQRNTQWLRNRWGSFAHPQGPRQTLAPEKPLRGKWKLTDCFCHEDNNHVLVTASLPSERSGLGTAHIHMEYSANGFGSYKRRLLVVELPEMPPTRTQDCEFTFTEAKAPFSSLYFYSWRKDGYLRTDETRFGSPCGAGWDSYEFIEECMMHGGTLTARIGTGTWTFALDGFVPVEQLVEHALDIRRQPSFSDTGGFARSLSFLEGAGLSMPDIQDFLIVEAAGLKLIVEGALDIRYICRAGELLGKSSVLDRINITEAGGIGNLRSFWKALAIPGTNLVRGPVLLLFDSDGGVKSETANNIHKRSLPLMTEHPLQRGIENLFCRALLERAIKEKPAFIDIVSEHQHKIRGANQTVPESWTVNPDEKTNLCDWICEHGAVSDFRHFKVVFDILEEVLP